MLKIPCLKSLIKSYRILFVEPWFVDQYYPKLMKCNSEDYIFYPEEKNRTKLYERIRKNFVRISSELGLYVFNGKRRPMYSIRHMNALKLYEDLKDINLVAQALNTDPKIVQSNYLNYSDEWARNRFKVLGYHKRKIAPIFNEVQKQGFYKKLKLSMKFSMKSFKKVLISVIKLFKG